VSDRSRSGSNGAPAASNTIAFDAYGVAIKIDVSDPSLLVDVRAVLPPGARETKDTEDTECGTRFVLTADGDVHQDGKPLATRQDRRVQMVVLDAGIRSHVAMTSPDHVFVHAGAVAIDGRALLLPGISFAGKTTLVAALVRAGATYYSDEYAVLDHDGRVHPYPKPLSLRLGRDARQTETAVGELGGAAGSGPASVAAVVLTSYRPGGRWDPVRRSSAEGALLLLSHTVPARKRPAESLARVQRAAAGAVVLEGERGPAEAIVGDLLALLAPPA
jgi:hypothetical protein